MVALLSPTIVPRRVSIGSGASVGILNPSVPIPVLVVFSGTLPVLVFAGTLPVLVFFSGTAPVLVYIVPVLSVSLLPVLSDTGTVLILVLVLSERLLPVLCGTGTVPVLVPVSYTHLTLPTILLV